uniref:Uncharacterized protein n=1 Tax=Ditylenchus dipsaci TaxID=166011 RepID=A0A915EDN9_9BILA
MDASSSSTVQSAFEATRTAASPPDLPKFIDVVAELYMNRLLDLYYSCLSKEENYEVYESTEGEDNHHGDFRSISQLFGEAYREPFSDVAASGNADLQCLANRIRFGLDDWYGTHS